MKEKKSYISCNCKTKCSFYTFLLPILFIIIRYFHDKFFELSKPYLSFKILKYNLPYLFYLYLPKIFSILLITIIKSNTKGESNNQEENIVLRKYHFIAITKNKKKMILLLYIISFLEVAQEYGDSILYYYQRMEIEKEKKIIKGWLIEKKTAFIVFVPILYYFILDKELHRHHILALILGFIGAFIINLYRFVLEFSDTTDYPFHLLNLFFSFLYSLALVFIKYIMSKYLILSPYIFLFYDGIFCIINSIICTLIFYILVINIPDVNPKIDIAEENNKYFSNNFLQIFTIFIGQEWEFYLYFFLSFIISFFYYVINALTIYNYSPYLFILIESCLPIDSDIFPIIFNNNVYDNETTEKIIKRTYIQVIGYIILFFASLILNEIIVFNFCGLNKNTFSKIVLRGDLDSSLKEINACGEIEEDNNDNISEREINGE